MQAKLSETCASGLSKLPVPLSKRTTSPSANPVPSGERHFARRSGNVEPHRALARCTRVVDRANDIQPGGGTFAQREPCLVLRRHLGTPFGVAGHQHVERSSRRRHLFFGKIRRNRRRGRLLPHFERAHQFAAGIDLQMVVAQLGTVVLVDGHRETPVEIALGGPHVDPLVAVTATNRPFGDIRVEQKSLLTSFGRKFERFERRFERQTRPFGRLVVAGGRQHAKAGGKEQIVYRLHRFKVFGIVAPPANSTTRACACCRRRRATTRPDARLPVHNSPGWSWRC